MALTLFIVGAHLIGVDGQCCPYVNSVEIAPNSPTELDSVYLLTNITTPNEGAYLGYEIINGVDNQITVKACYWEGEATALKAFSESINLGLLDIGDYTIDFIALSSSLDSICMPIDSNAVQLEFNVSSSVSTTEVQKSELDILCFPNPIVAETLNLQSNQEIQRIDLIDVLGNVVLKRTDNMGLSVELDLKNLKPGLYFVKIASSENELIKKVLKL